MGVPTQLVARSRRSASRALVAGCLLAGLLGCAGTLGRSFAYQYFALAGPEDPWAQKIAMWQARERAERVDLDIPAPAAVAGSGEEAGGSPPSEDLRVEYAAFRREQKRAQARELAAWIQDQARVHYRPDGPIDHWATLDETLRNNGDDCDGLELLVYHLLRDLGFGDDEVYRAIVYRRSDGQHHMVTFWFESGDDPWVIDPTGAMTSGMPRMSEVAGWEPLKVFSEDQNFSVQRLASH